MNQRLQNATAIVVMLCSIAATSAFVFGSLRRGAPAATQDDGRATWIRNSVALGQGGHVRGAAKARLSIIEFADYQCPACRSFEPTLRELLRRHPNDVRVVFRNYPLRDIHPQAFAAARAAECAGAQGRFDPYHDVLYVTQESLGVIPWAQLARRAGVPDTMRFKHCLADTVVPVSIQRDMKVAETLKLVGTPSIIINDSLYSGTRPLAFLEGLLATYPATRR